MRNFNLRYECCENATKFSKTRSRYLLAEVAQHVEREDQQHHAVVARKARARPVLGRPARELRDAQHGHALQREELRRARPLKAEHHVELLGDHGRHEHGQADAEHPAPPLGVLQPVVVVEDAEHEEEGHGVERPQVREGHDVEQGLTLPDQVIEEEKDRFVELIPEACLSGQQPARKEQYAKDCEAQHPKPSFCCQENILLSRKSLRVNLLFIAIALARHLPLRLPRT